VNLRLGRSAYVCKPTTSASLENGIVAGLEAFNL